MVAASKKFYITTAIDYPNGRPHMGHAYEKIVTDFYARWYRLIGKEVYFLTGTDENGQKLVKSAEDAKIDTRCFIDSQVLHFRELCKNLLITNNDFIRTTEPRHQQVAQKLWQVLKQKGDIYFGHYSGQYCLACESFYTETQAPEGCCPAHGTQLQKKEEEGYFLKMASYDDWIKSFLKTHQEFIVPRKSYNEVMGRLEGEALRDLAISRPNQGWGIPVPDDDKFVMYTWFDALINYYTATQIPAGNESLWPADLHVIGKDIVWFHTVIWPIILHACDLALPRQVYVHGMVLAEDGRKMSKSLNNGVDPNDIINKYPIDSFRYYLLRAISAHSDGPFSERELLQKHNSELANDLGNLFMRVVKFAKKRLGDDYSSQGIAQELFLPDLYTKVSALIETREHHKAIETIWDGVKEGNQYVNIKEPWKIKDDEEKLRAVIFNLLYAIHHLCVLLVPVLPTVSLKLLDMMGAPLVPPQEMEYGKYQYKLKEPEIPFQKFEV